MHTIDYDSFFAKLEANEFYKDLLSTKPADLSFRDLSVLLQLIQVYSGAQTTIILRDRKDIQEKLRGALKTGSFRGILSELFPDAPPHEEPVEDKEAEKKKAKEIEQRVEKAWNTPYQGSLHKLLFKNINAMKGDAAYKNICAIIQSSGTGKSRMVDEQAKLVYTLPINIRTKKGIYVAYPAPDDNLRAYLIYEAVSEQHYHVFFKHLFSHAIEVLEQIKTYLDIPKAELATTWHQYMMDTERRRRFYQEVVDMCRAGFKSGLSSIGPGAVLETLHQLIKRLDEWSDLRDEKVKIVIYIDEAHELDHLLGERSNFAEMCSVLASFASEPLFVLLLSTQSSLPLLAPPGSTAASERARRAGSELLAPITEVPFDCAPDIQVEAGKLHLEDLWTIKYLAKWGRPLWWTMFDASSSELGALTGNKIIEFARMKLLAHHSIHCKLSDLPSAAQVAVVDVLLALDFEPRRDSFTLQTDMVKSHMRIAYSVPQHREYLRSGYSSESVLAEAAAQQILHFKREAKMDSTLGVMIQLLKGPMDNTLLDLGQRGEVVMRLLLMDAYMEAVIAGNVSLPFFSRGCPLVTFITQLFSPEVSVTILASRPDNREDLSEHFRLAFQHSVVRFTHFVKAIDECAVTTVGLFAAFARGMAFICHRTQKSVDIVIPVLYDKRKPPEESNVTALLVQVKRRDKAAAPLKYQFGHKAIGLFPKNDTSNRPYITFVAELGVDSRREPVDVGPSEDPELSPGDTHPRYHVTIYGRSNTVYKAAKGFDDKLESLLAAHKFLSNHPRKGDSITATMAMKPAWEFGEPSFHWVSDPRLNGAEPKSGSKGTKTKKNKTEEEKKATSPQVVASSGGPPATEASSSNQRPVPLVIPSHATTPSDRQLRKRCRTS